MLVGVLTDKLMTGIKKQPLVSKYTKFIERDLAK